MRARPWLQRAAAALPDADTCDKLVVAGAIGVLAGLFLAWLFGGPL